MKLTQEIVREFLSYDASTGAFVWKAREEKWFKNLRFKSRWNTRYAGKKAFQWMDRDGYYLGDILNSTYRAHRIAWLHAYGKWPTGQIDHINGVRSDNRLENLRDVCSAENNRNRRMDGRNTSGRVGVQWGKNEKKWRAIITVDRQAIHLGSFHRKQDAIAARAKAEIEHGFHPNHGRSQ